jgi:hypothetical protein
MIFKKALAAFMVFGALTTQAQEVSIINGPQFSMNNRKEEFVNILNMDRNNFSFLTKKGLKTYRVMTLNQKLSVSKSTELDIPEIKGKELKFVSASQIGEKTYFFSQNFDKKKQVMSLYASDLDVKKGKFNQHVEAMTIKDDKYNIFTRPFQIIKSIDSSKIMMVATYPTRNKDKARIAVLVTDNNLNEIWKKDIVFDQLDKNFTVLNYLVDKDGNVHITASIRMDNDEKRAKGAKGRYYVAIYSYFHETGELKNYEIGFTNEIILSANIELNHNNELIGTGFYGDKKVFDAGMKGFFYFRIDTKTKEVVARNLSPFDKKFLGELMSKNRAEKGKGIYNYLVRKTYARPDGGMTVVAEYYFYDEMYDQNGNLVAITWIYGNVLVYNIDKDGKMIAVSILKKNQMAQWRNSAINQLMGLAGISIYPGGNEVPYYGIGSMMKDGMLYLIYNENPKNAERLKAGKKPRSVRQRSSETMLVTVDAEGGMKSNTLFKSRDKKAGYSMPLMPRYHFNYSADGMIIIGRKGKNARVCELQVD